MTESKQYRTIRICNVPKTTDQFTKAHPSRSCLEYWAEPEKGKGKGGKTYHISTVDIDACEKTTSFHILLDGILYGPLTKIRISPSRNIDDPYSFKIMKYLPNDTTSGYF